MKHRTICTTCVAIFIFLSSKFNFIFTPVAHSYSLSIPTGGGLFIQNKNANKKHKTKHRRFKFMQKLNDAQKTKLEGVQTESLIYPVGNTQAMT
jgi:hypothetical protein